MAPPLFFFQPPPPQPDPVPQTPTLPATRSRSIPEQVPPGEPGPKVSGGADTPPTQTPPAAANQPNPFEPPAADPTVVPAVPDPAQESAPPPLAPATEAAPPPPPPPEAERAPGLEAKTRRTPATVAAEQLGAPPLLRRNTRFGYFTFSSGRSSLLESGGLSDRPRTSPGLMLEEAIGVYVSQRTYSDSSLALVFQQSFLSGPFDSQEYTFGPRLTFDIPIDQNLGIYVSPSMLAGYNLSSQGDVLYDYDASYEDDRTTRTREHRLDVQFGLAAKLLLADRLELSFRPFQLQIVTDFTDYSIRWNMMAGIGITVG